MAKKNRHAKQKKQNEFRFHKRDSIGAADALDDIEMLKKCFVDTGDISRLKDFRDNHSIVLGRTGTGKTALLETIAADSPHIIKIAPDALALNHISNSTVIHFFEEAGLNLDPFYKLLWRHVITIELFQTHFDLDSEEGKKSWIAQMKERFSKQSKNDVKRRKALEYLNEWGGRFWEDTEHRVREVTSRIEKGLTSSIGARAKLLEASSEEVKKLSEEVRSEIVQLGQKAVNDAQVQELAEILNLVNELFDDPQQQYFIVIDRLDENWVEDRIRYKLIMALIETCRDFCRIENVKLLIALRRDLLDRVFRLTEPSAQQREKYEFMELPLRWSRTDLLKILDTRISELVTSRSRGKHLTHRDLLPKDIKGTPIGDYLYLHARRPRDIIRLFNACIARAEGGSKVTLSQFREAMGDYSRSRLQALYDEWKLDYPHLSHFTELLQGRPESCKLDTFDLEIVGEACLELMVRNPQPIGLLHIAAREVVDSLRTPEDFLRSLALVFYKIGLVGIKLHTHEKTTWIDDDGRTISAAEITPQCSVVVQPSYHRALGITPNP